MVFYILYFALALRLIDASGPPGEARPSDLGPDDDDAPTVVSGEFSTADFDHIVVLPDVHGDRIAFIASLWIAYMQVDGSLPALTVDDLVKVFDDEDAENDTTPIDLISAKSHRVALVQLGDMVDRGPESEECLMVLLIISRVLGWTVFPLVGNHEVMNVLGRASEYFHPDEQEGEEEALRAGLFTIGSDFYFVVEGMLLAARLSGPPGSGRSGARNPNTLFVHGGIELDWFDTTMNDPKAGKPTVDSLNAYFGKNVRTKESLEEQFASETGNKSPIWTRKLARGMCGDWVDDILNHFAVGRIVIGHTVQKDRLVKSRCDGKVILTDIMMSEWMAQRAEVDQFTSRPVAMIMTMNKADRLLDSINAYHTEGWESDVIVHTPIFSIH